MCIRNEVVLQRQQPLVMNDDDIRTHLLLSDKYPPSLRSCSIASQI